MTHPTGGPQPLTSTTSWDANQRHTAELLGKSEQAVSKDRHLLRIRNQDGRRVVYPIVQFDGQRPVAGLDQILAIFDDTPAVEILVWLTGTMPEHEHQRPIDLLRDHQLSAVMTAAQRYMRHSR